MHELDTTNFDGNGSEAFQAKHSAQLGLYIAMVLFDQIVQLLGQAKRRVVGKRALLLKFASGTVESSITVERNGLG